MKSPPTWDGELYLGYQGYHGKARRGCIGQVIICTIMWWADRVGRVREGERETTSSF